MFLKYFHVFISVCFHICLSYPYIYTYLFMCVCMYLLTPLLGQDMTQGQFLSGV